MNQNMNLQEFPSGEPMDNFPLFDSNPPFNQNVSSRGRSQNYYQGSHPGSNPRMRQQKEFHQRGRYPYNKRGGNIRSQTRNRNVDQQQGATSNNSEYATSTSNNPYNRNLNTYFRESMLVDPWANITPKKVPPGDKTLVIDGTYS